MSQSNPTYSYDTITITSSTGDSSQQELFTLPDLNNNMNVSYQNNIAPITAGTGFSGVYTTGNIYNWNTITTGNGTDTISIADWGNARQNTLDVKGDANFEGDVKIKGKSVSDMIEKIEERLAILHPNPELEEKWDELKELGKRYKELEKEIIEKEKMWAILKK